MPNILIVDDDQTIRSMFSRVLSKHGTIALAATGEEALSVLTATKFDAITLDLAMPKVDGFGVLDQLGSPHALNHATPVLIVTANPQDQAMTRTFEGGAMLFLTKPVSILQLSTFIEMALQHGRRPKRS